MRIDLVLIDYYVVVRQFEVHLLLMPRRRTLQSIVHCVAATGTVLLSLLDDVVDLFLHAGGAAEDGSGVLLDQLLGEEASFLVEVPLLLVLLLHLLVTDAVTIHPHVILTSTNRSIASTRLKLICLKLFIIATLPPRPQFLQLFLCLLSQLSNGILIDHRILTLQSHHLHGLPELLVAHGVQIL